MFILLMRFYLRRVKHETQSTKLSTMCPKTVLITGCSAGGIGDALAKQFFKHGFRVFATARNVTKIQHLEEMGMDILVLDVTDERSIKQAAETIRQEGAGPLDILINNAGGGSSSYVDKSTSQIEIFTLTDM